MWSRFARPPGSCPAVRRTIGCLDFAATLIAIAAGVVMAILGESFGFVLAGCSVLYLLTFVPWGRWFGG